ncbi:MAG: hypothetical protein GXX91_14415 [Verrucomicrobiaceae bacterium]|nr:hypothetical protein [Verrucomicrobiaceae bacterium]
MTAKWAFLCWIAIQVFGGWRQVSGFGHVSHIAHLGGASVGLVAWFWWRFLAGRGEGNGK